MGCTSSSRQDRPAAPKDTALGNAGGLSDLLVFRQDQFFRIDFPFGCPSLIASCPHPASISSPRLRRTVAVISWLTSRSEEHTSELQSRGHLVCRLLLEKKKYPMISDQVSHRVTPKAKRTTIHI